MRLPENCPVVSRCLVRARLQYMHLSLEDVSSFSVISQLARKNFLEKITNWQNWKTIMEDGEMSCDPPIFPST